MSGMAERVEIPERALRWQFVRSRGPGGQNVNKVATAVQLHVDAHALGEPRSVVARLIKLAGSRATRDGQIVIFCDSARTQNRNREIALERLTELLERARVVPKRRIPTKPSRAAKAARLDRKRRNSATKSNRRKPSISD